VIELVCLTLVNSGLYYKPTTIVNDDSRVVTKLETSLTDDTSHHLQLSHVYCTGHSIDIMRKSTFVALNVW
jgi:hypothetical protein